MALEECGFCGKLAAFKQVEVVLCDERDEDQCYAADECANCGEYNGQVRGKVDPEILARIGVEP